MNCCFVGCFNVFAGLIFGFLVIFCGWFCGLCVLIFRKRYDGLDR